MRLVSVNTEEARKAKKVLTVLTAADMKAANVGSVSRHPPVQGRAGAKMIMPFRPSLAGEKVMHVGDPVAMVVAETRSQPPRTRQTWFRLNMRNCRR